MLFITIFTNNFNPSDYQTERININKCSLIISYNKNEYSPNSPFLLHTLGNHSNKTDFKFDLTKTSLMDRGIIYAYPVKSDMVELDDEWFVSKLRFILTYKI